jgi:hypothetical protein
MATKIIHKKSSVASSVPAAGDLEPGEIAVNLADQKLYSKTTGGTVIELAPDTAGGIAYTLHTANVTMAANEGVIANTSGGAFTVTLPASPTTGDTVVIADGADWETTNLTVGRNGSTIEGDAADMTMDIGGVFVQFTYDGTTWQIYMQLGANGGNAVVEGSSPTFAGLTVDTDTLFVDATNNRLGIGKTNPATPLDVTGTVTATAFAGDGSALTGVGGGIYQSITSTDVTTAVATVEFDLDTTTYKEFLLRTREVIIASDGQNLLIQVSPDDGVTWRTTGYAGYCSVTSTYYSSTVGLWIGAVLDNGTAGGGTNMDTIIYNAGDSGKFTGTSTTGTVYHYTAGSLFQGGGSAYQTTETHNKMRVITTSGNITSGTFELMGEPI